MHRRAACAAAGLALLVGCGGDDREAVLAVMEDARTAVRKGDGQRACRLLTERGREQALAFGDVATCEATVREVRRRDPSSIEDLGRAPVTVESIDGDRATARIQAPDGGPDYDFTLVKTDAGWRIDNSDAVPQGEN